MSTKVLDRSWRRNRYVVKLVSVMLAVVMATASIAVEVIDITPMTPISSIQDTSPRCADPPAGRTMVDVVRQYLRLPSGMEDWEVERVLASPLGDVARCVAQMGVWGDYEYDIGATAALDAQLMLLEYAFIPTGEVDDFLAGLLATTAPAILEAWAIASPSTLLWLASIVVGVLAGVYLASEFIAKYVDLFVSLVDADRRESLLHVYISNRRAGLSKEVVQQDLWSAEEIIITELDVAGSDGTFESYQTFFAWLEASYQATRIATDATATAELRNTFQVVAEVMRVYDTPDADSGLGFVVVGSPDLSSFTLVNRGPLRISSVVFEDRDGAPVSDIQLPIQAWGDGTLALLNGKTVGDVETVVLNLDGMTVRVPFDSRVYSSLWVGAPSTSKVSNDTFDFGIPEVISAFSESPSITWSESAIGEIGTGSSVRYKFACPGLKRVVLDVQVAGQLQSRAVSVEAVLPFGVSWSSDDDDNTILPGQSVVLRVSDEVPDQGYDVTWNFGDGSAGVSGRTVTHTFETEGYFDVTVSVIPVDGSCPAVTSRDKMRVGRSSTWIELPSNLDGDRYGPLKSTFAGYIVPSGGVTVTGRLTAEPGTRIQVRTSVTPNYTRRGYIQVDGEIDFVGTADFPVVITSQFDTAITGDSSQQPTERSWESIRVAPSGVANFEHTTIRYAGTAIENRGRVVFKSSEITNSLEGIQSAHSSSTLIRDSVISAQNSAVTSASSDYFSVRSTVLTGNTGVTLTGVNTFSELNGVTFRDTGIAVSATPSASGITVRDSTVTGSSRGVIQVLVGGFPIGTTVWSADLPYYQRTSIWTTDLWDIRAGGRLDIAPGSTVLFDDGSSVNTQRRGGIRALGGVVTAIGSPGAPITMSSYDGERWGHLLAAEGGRVIIREAVVSDLIHGLVSSGPGSRLEVTDVEVSYSASAVAVENRGLATIDRLNVHDSATGISLSGADGSSTVSNSSFVDLATGISLSGTEPGVEVLNASFDRVNVEVASDFVSSGTTLVGTAVLDGDGQFAISPGSLGSSSNIVWSIDLPIRQLVYSYDRRALKIPAGSSLVIEAGTTVEMGYWSTPNGVTRGVIEVAGELFVDGTLEAPVLLDVSGPSGRWDGIDVSGSVTITHTEIRSVQTALKQRPGSSLNVSDLVVSEVGTAFVARGDAYASVANVSVDNALRGVDIEGDGLRTYQFLDLTDVGVGVVAEGSTATNTSLHGIVFDRVGKEVLVSSQNIGLPVLSTLTLDGEGFFDVGYGVLPVDDVVIRSDLTIRQLRSFSDGYWTIPTDGSLTISAGTRLEMMYLATPNGRRYRGGLRVDGDLFVNGTDADPVVFVGQGGTVRSWSGFLVKGYANVDYMESSGATIAFTTLGDGQVRASRLLVDGAGIALRVGELGTDPNVAAYKVRLSNLAGVGSGIDLSFERSVDARENWWGSQLGPEFETGEKVLVEPWCLDPACASFSAFDSAPPVVVGVVNPLSNAAGWWNSVVTVDWLVVDPEPSAGLGVLPGPTVVLDQGAAITVLAEACDLAGNCGSGSVVLSIDYTSPTISGSPDFVANAAGWNNTEVVVSFECTDLSSGLADCSAPVTLGEGASQIVVGSASDVAGNFAQTSVEVSVDLTDPVATLDAPLDGSTILLADYVAPTCSAIDALSGVDGTCSVAINEPVAAFGVIVYTAVGTATDLAGNESSVSSTFTVIIDTAAPEIVATASPLANATGWWNTAVTFNFVCIDDDAGVEACPDPVIIDTEGSSQSFTVSAYDYVGNVGYLVVGGINVDLSAPEIVFVGAAESYTVADLIEIDCVATDALSGIASADCPDLVISGAELGTGTHTLTATATDVAGNVTVVSVSFTVSVDPASLEQVVDGYLSTGGPGNSGVTVALVDLLDSGGYTAFVNLVEAQCCTPERGKRFTEEQAAILIALAEELQTQAVANSIV